MKVVIFGASGMVGHGILLEALDNPEITQVLTVGRSPVPVSHAKLEQIEHRDFTDFSAIADRFEGVDAVFWALGVSSAGMSETDYTRVTHTFTMAAATTLLERSPQLRFCFVSGQGTDSSESGRTMWARVKGRAENDLQRLGFEQVICFRPGFISPMRGVKSKVAMYRFMYVLLTPLGVVLRSLNWGTSTVQVGRAMIAAAQGKAQTTILDNRGINELATLV